MLPLEEPLEELEVDELEVELEVEEPDELEVEELEVELEVDEPEELDVEELEVDELELVLLPQPPRRASASCTGSNTNAGIAAITINWLSLLLFMTFASLPATRDIINYCFA